MNNIDIDDIDLYPIESSTGGSKVGRYSFIGCNPYKVVTTTSPDDDPLVLIEESLKDVRYVSYGDLPYFTGGAVGYVYMY